MRAPTHEPTRVRLNGPFIDRPSKARFDHWKTRGAVMTPQLSYGDLIIRLVSYADRTGFDPVLNAKIPAPLYGATGINTPEGAKASDRQKLTRTHRKIKP